MSQQQIAALLRLVAALRKVVRALNAYLDDAEESGCENYDLSRLVPIPREQPSDDASDEVWEAWDVKVAVVAAEKAYVELLGGRPILPDDEENSGLQLWKKLLSHSREHKSGAAIYNAGRALRAWAERETGRLQADEPPDPIEEALRYQLLKLYRYLRDRKHWTSYDTLRESNEFWRKGDPDDETIHRALRRLRAELSTIESPVALVIDHQARRTKLDK